MKRPYLRAFWASLVVAASLLFAGVAEGAAPRVLAVEFENDVNPVTADYVTDQIERANDEGYDAVVILLDTPGGLSTAMKDIYQAELASTTPVLVYVSPDGARAASAGVWIVQAGDLAAMAPSTNIGSSTPVASGGGEIPSDLRRKAINDAAKSLRALAETHGRNGDWAEQAVRKADNLTAAGGARPERDRRDRADAARVARGGRRADNEARRQGAPDGRRRDRTGRDGPLEVAPRPARRPEPDRPDALDRRARDRGRALEPGPRLPGHGRRDLVDRRAVRTPSAADQRRRPAADAARDSASSPPRPSSSATARSRSPARSASSSGR